jgi:hypothetical protein
MSRFTNVIQQNPTIDYIENLNKTLYDQSVLLQPTISYMNAYALMPTDNSGAIVVGGDVQFPRLYSSSATDIVPLTVSSFTLGPIGVYDVYFQVGITDVSGSQLILTLNNTQLPSTVSGAVGTNTIVGRCMITTTLVNSVVTVRNPSGNPRSITVTSSLGGASPVAAQLIITRLR